MAGDDDEVGAVQRQVDCPLPVGDPHGPADEGVEHPPDTAGPGRRRAGAAAQPDVRPHQLRSRRERSDVDECPEVARRGAGDRPGGQQRAGRALLVQSGQRLPGGIPAVDDDGRHRGAGRGLERCLPAGVDLDEVDQRADDAVDASQQLPTARPFELLERPGEGLGPGRRPVPLLLG